MMLLSSSEFHAQLTSAGVTFIPADTTYYTDFSYKVEFSPKFKGLGGITGDRYCTIKLGNPAKALADAAELLLILIIGRKSVILSSQYQ
jgi:hypothetical protein